MDSRRRYPLGWLMLMLMLTAAWLGVLLVLVWELAWWLVWTVGL